MNIQRFFFLTLAMILVVCCYEGNLNSANRDNFELNKNTPLMEKGNEKLDSLLNQLMNIYKKEGASKAIEFARAWPYPVRNNEVIIFIVSEESRRADIKGNNPNIRRIKNKLMDLNAKIYGIVDNFIEAKININNLLYIADMREVKKITVPLFKKHLMKSEGVNVTGANQWQLPQVQFTKPSEPIKVAVLDLGFKGYDNLLGIELPSQVVTRSFRKDNDISAGEEHGTAVAEIIHDMAPDAKMYLVNFDLFSEFQEAVSWLISEKVNIISFSIGYFNAGAGDGTGPVNEVVNSAINSGITWVVAAGNEAVSHWRGAFVDWDGDRWLNFNGSDESNSFFAQAGDDVYVFMNWNDWYETDQDYDLYIFDNAGNRVAVSDDLQDGDDWPVEGVYFYAPHTGTYHISVYRYRANKPAQIEFFTSKDYIEYFTRASSLTIPADNPKAITAGATYWNNDELEYYSSRGPTKDGRIKPDFTAPDGVSTVSYGAGSFYGTSAATPHVSGAFALLADKINIFSLNEIKKIIESRSIDYGEPGKDNLFGIGRLYLLPK